MAIALQRPDGTAAYRVRVIEEMSLEVARRTPIDLRGTLRVSGVMTFAFTSSFQKEMIIARKERDNA